MTRPEPARMRIVPEVATGPMGAAAGRLYDQCAVENYGAPPDAEAVYAAMLDAAPSAGLVSREMVDAMAEAQAIARHQLEYPGEDAWWWLRTRVSKQARELRAKDIYIAAAAIAALGLTVAPAADTAREREGG